VPAILLLKYSMKVRESKKSSVSSNLTSTEKKLFLLACMWKRSFDDSNPDVGWGDSCLTTVQDIATQVGITLENDDLTELVKILGEKDA
jgi:hypothetical protein